MDTIAPPIFRQIDNAQCLEILGRNHVGRIAYARQNQIDIEPVHYIYSDGWIFGRTSKGRKMEMTGYSWWPVAFEVDEVDGLFDPFQAAGQAQRSRIGSTNGTTTIARSTARPGKRSR